MFTQHSLQVLLKQQIEGKLTTFQIGFLIYFLLLGPGLLLVAITLLTISNTNTAFFWLLGIIHSGILTWTVLDFSNDKTCAQLLLDEIEHKKKFLVWAYTEKIYRDEYTLTRIEIHFLFLNKKHGTISSTQSDFDQFQQVFTDTFPYISIGYSDDLARRYKQNPESLLNNPQRYGMDKITKTSSPFISN